MSNNKGFTLIEIVLVMAIIGILGTSILPSMEKSRQRAMATTNDTNLRVIKSAAMMYLADNPDADKIELDNIKPYIEDADSLKVPKGLVGKDKKVLDTYVINLDNGKITVDVN